MRSSRRLARLAVLACATGYVVVPPPPRRATLRRATRSSDKLEEPAAGPDPLAAKLAATALSSAGAAGGWAAEGAALAASTYRHLHVVDGALACAPALRACFDARMRADNLLDPARACWDRATDGGIRSRRDRGRLRCR